MLTKTEINGTFWLAALIWCLPLSTTAQVIPDGSTSTTVTTEDNISTIENGDRAGNNLFHSFSDFSVPNGNEAFFNNAADVTNIFTRVTGGNTSSIDGSIRANDANLFLINPAGILFGSDARLDLGGGSFYGTSADSILFEDGEFTADLDNPPLLTVNAPIGLNFRDDPAPIEVNGSNLAVAPGQNLTLLGGNVTLTNSARLFTPGANVELGAVSGSRVELDSNLKLNFSDNLALADVSFNNDVAINVTSDDGGSITINARNVELSQNSRLIAGIGDNAGTPEAQAGNIVINATENITLDGNSFIVNRAGSNGQGRAGNIQLGAASDIILDGNSFILNEVAENGIGDAGNVQIATSALTLNNRSIIGSQTFGTGNSGNVAIDAENISINSGSSLRSLVRSGASGNAGDLIVNTGVLTAETVEGSSEVRSLIFSNTFGEGDAGDIKIDATDSIVLDNSSVLAQVREGASGDGGDVTINTPFLEVTNSASEVLTASGIFTDTEGTGNAGNINLTTNDALILERRSSIGAGTTSEGDAGDIKIRTNLLSISNFALLATNIRQNATGDAGTIAIAANDIDVSVGGIIDTSIVDTSRPTDFTGGDININANTLDLTSGGKIATNTSNSSGDAGNLNLTIADRITIDGSNAAVLPPEFADFQEPDPELESITGILASTRLGATGNGGNINIISPDAAIDIANGEAQISVSSQGQGSGGSIGIEAEELTLDNNGSILASTPSGQGGSISLNIDDTITLRNESRITARAFSNADGGNIDINTDFIVAFASEPNGSDIIASAESGNGGNITITAEQLLGLQERTSTAGNGSNDIDASSEFGFDGNVLITTPDVNSFQGVVELATNVVESNDTVARGCSANSVAGSSLVLTGQQKIIPQPTDALNSEDLIGIEQSSTISNNYSQLEPSLAIATGVGDIYLARGAVRREDGTVVLTAYPVTRNSRTIAKQNCQSSY